MGYSEVVETRGKYRVVLKLDEDAEKPYDDGQSPILRLDHGYHTWKATHVMVGARPTDDDESIQRAGERWGSDIARLERYLRIFYGTTQIQRYDTRDYIYITYDTEAWRKYVGFKDGALPPADSINMNEWQAWCEGEVYGYVVEKLVHWTTEDDDYEDNDNWEDAGDSCWGFYGMEYATEAAKEALSTYNEETVTA